MSIRPLIVPTKGAPPVTLSVGTVDCESLNVRGQPVVPNSASIPIYFGGKGGPGAFFQRCGLASSETSYDPKAPGYAALVCLPSLVGNLAYDTAAGGPETTMLIWRNGEPVAKTPLAGPRGMVVFEAVAPLVPGDVLQLSLGSGEPGPAQFAIHLEAAV